MKSIEDRQRSYLLDILLAARAISTYVHGYSLVGFLGDQKTQDTVLRQLMVIGEAAARLEAETVAEFSRLPVRRMLGMRNRIVHE